MVPSGNSLSFADVGRILRRIRHLKASRGGRTRFDGVVAGNPGLDAVFRAARLVAEDLDAAGLHRLDVRPSPLGADGVGRGSQSGALHHPPHCRSRKRGNGDDDRQHQEHFDEGEGLAPHYCTFAMSSSEPLAWSGPIDQMRN